MRRTIVVLIFLISFAISSCNNNKTAGNNPAVSFCSDGCNAKSNGEFVCKLTTAELQKRKETVLASLKAQITETKELKNGYAFKFPGTDAVVDELTEFIKTERECCSFFTFNLSVSGDKSEVWLELTGADGVKDFIKGELGL